MDKVFLPCLVSCVDQNLLCSGSEAFSQIFIIVTEVRSDSTERRGGLMEIFSLLNFMGAGAGNTLYSKGE